MFQQCCICIVRLRWCKTFISWPVVISTTTIAIDNPSERKECSSGIAPTERRSSISTDVSAIALMRFFVGTHCIAKVLWLGTARSIDIAKGKAHDCFMCQPQPQDPAPPAVANQKNACAPAGYTVIRASTWGCRSHNSTGACFAPIRTARWRICSMLRSTWIEGVRGPADVVRPAGRVAASHHDAARRDCGGGRRCGLGGPQARSAPVRARPAGAAGSTEAAAGRHVRAAAGGRPCWLRQGDADGNTPIFKNPLDTAGVCCPGDRIQICFQYKNILSKH